MSFLFNTLFYAFGRLLVFVIQCFPLLWIVYLGRAMGAVAFVLDRRHRRVAIGQLEWFLKQTGRPGHAKEMAREHFCRLGEGYLSAIKTAGMSMDALEKHIEFRGVDIIRDPANEDTPAKWKQTWIVAIGHFGNFELYARSFSRMDGFVGAATFRGLKQPGFNRLLQELRTRSGVRFFDRRQDVDSLKQLMNEGSVVLGLLADQAAGSGVMMDFFGEPCRCSTAPAVFAQRYHCRLTTGICYRKGPAQWLIEFGPEIPMQANGERRSVEDVTIDINRALEKAILEDPLNWFWVHDRWKRYRKPKKWDQPAG